MEKALDDITMLDLGQVIAMPYCTMLLADLGARVIKVESRAQAQERLSLGVKRVRDGVEERVPVHQYRERNKQAITLDLKNPRGVELFKELVRRADVVAENFSVGTMDRLGLGYDTLKQINSRLIYASVTAFGQYGPYAHWRGYDILAQAISGYMSITGFPDHPPTRSGQSISDYYAGMLCAF
jgi:CoA:oxalate CoA-transferase